jgi:hypothetical protein
MSFLRSKIVVVRKDRKCFGCRAEIKFRYDGGEK